MRIHCESLGPVSCCFAPFQILSVFFFLQQTLLNRIITGPTDTARNHLNMASFGEHKIFHLPPS